MDDMRQLFARPTILAAVGMATVFTAVHNQLMFPITFTYAKEGAPAPILLYLIYALLQVLTCTALFVGRTSIGKTVFANPIRMGIFGAFGVIGTALLIVCGFSTPTSSLCVAFGVALFSLYVPVYFVFWQHALRPWAREHIAADTSWHSTQPSPMYCFACSLPCAFQWASMPPL